MNNPNALLVRMLNRAHVEPASRVTLSRTHYLLQQIKVKITYVTVIARHGYYLRKLRQTASKKTERRRKRVMREKEEKGSEDRNGNWQQCAVCQSTGQGVTQ